MRVIKASGEETSYDPKKIIHSLERVGASRDITQKVLAATEREVFDGISTKTLYQILFKNLKKLSLTTASKYHLKKAIMALGPTGFPFEKFIAAVLHAEGFQTMTDQIVEGMCVKHEIDVIAEKENKEFLIECKFHSRAGNACDVKDALYVHARFLDVEKKWHKSPSHARRFHQIWLVTNTRLTTDAEQYGKCVGMGLLSWNHPPGNSLRERIDRKGLYPITCLTRLTKHEVAALLEQGIVLASALCGTPTALGRVGLSKERESKVLEEAHTICEGLPI